MAAQLWPAAATGADAAFKVGSVEFLVGIPAGYCLPTGPQVEAVRVMAASDERNVTHLAFYPCHPPANADAHPPMDYIVLKSPRSLLNAEVNRGEFLAGLGQAFKDPAFEALLRSGKLYDDAGKSASQALGLKVDLSGTVRPRGTDESCAYLGGTLDVQSAVRSYRLALGACMTAVGGKAVATYYYGSDASSDGVGRLIVKAKRLALAIRRRPAR